MVNNKTTVKKMSQGYGYKYSDLSTIHEEMERQGITYYQYIDYDIEAGMDYVYTVLNYDGEEKPARRGCRVVLGDGMKSAAQEQGSGLTYARRYSLLMALGWATEDDDGDAVGKAAPAPSRANKVDFRQVREKLQTICDENDLAKYWNELKLSDKQAAILKGDFAKRKAELGGGDGVER